MIPLDRHTLYIDDVSEGMAIPSHARTFTRVSVFMFGVAYFTAHRIHYDRQWAEYEGYDDILVTAPLLNGMLVKMINQWTGNPWGIRKLSLQSRGFVHPEQPVTAYGLVRTVDSDSGLAECDIFVERDSDGNKSVVGTATVHLPSRQ